MGILDYAADQSRWLFMDDWTVNNGKTLDWRSKMVDIVDGIDGAEGLRGVVVAASFQNCAEGPDSGCLPFKKLNQTTWDSKESISVTMPVHPWPISSIKRDSSDMSS